MTEIGDGLSTVSKPLRRLWFLPILAAIIAGGTTVALSNQTTHTFSGVINTRAATTIPSDRFDLIADITTASRLSSVLADPAKVAGISVAKLRARLTVARLGDSTLASVTYTSPENDSATAQAVIEGVVRNAAAYLSSSGVDPSDSSDGDPVDEAVALRDKAATEVADAVIANGGAPPDQELAALEERLVTLTTGAGGGSAANKPRIASLQASITELLPAAQDFDALNAHLEQATAAVDSANAAQTELLSANAALAQSIQVTFEKSSPTPLAENPALRRVVASAAGGAALVTVMLLLVGVARRGRAGKSPAGRRTTR